MDPQQQTPAQDKTPENRPKRPVYNTYNTLIASLVQATIARIRNTPEPPQAFPKVPGGPRIRRLATQYVRGKKLARKAESVLNRMNLQVNDHGTVDWGYRYKDTLRTRPNKRRQQRIDRVTEMKIRATVDTLAMTPKEAKAYLVKFQKQLAKL